MKVQQLLEQDGLKQMLGRLLKRQTDKHIGGYAVFVTTFVKTVNTSKPKKTGALEDMQIRIKFVLEFPNRTNGETIYRIFLHDVDENGNTHGIGEWFELNPEDDEVLTIKKLNGIPTLMQKNGSAIEV